MNHLLSREEIADVAEELRSQGKKIVFTNGCFDILHVGHVRYLQAASQLGDVLIVGLNTDVSVRKLKGPSRPVNNENDRAEVLLGLACVDYVTLFGESTPEAVMELIKPDVHVKGGDYTEDQLPEAKIVRAYGGEVIIIPLVEGKSTTNIIKKINTGANESASA
jgi:D-glycero-beta-D-manno-heptose 1-phosphate adenylyltransferase